MANKKRESAERNPIIRFFKRGGGGLTGAAARGLSSRERRLKEAEEAAMRGKKKR